MNKSILALRICFVLYLALFGLSLLDYQFVDAVDYGQNSPVVIIFPLAVAIFFLACVILGMIVLLTTREPRPDTNTAKWLMALPYVISPLPIALFLSFGNLTSGEGLNESAIPILWIILIVCVGLIVSLFYSIYAYSIFWSRAKKITFAAFQSLIGLVVGFTIMIITFFGMHDGSLS